MGLRRSSMMNVVPDSGLAVCVPSWRTRRMSGPLRILFRRNNRSVAHMNNAVAVFGSLRIVRNHKHRLRSEEHTSELQSPFLISYAVFCLKKKKTGTISILLGNRTVSFDPKT